jgi:hypothetical protein
MFSLPVLQPSLERLLKASVAVLAVVVTLSNAVVDVDARRLGRGGMGCTSAVCEPEPPELVWTETPTICQIRL